MAYEDFSPKPEVANPGQLSERSVAVAGCARLEAGRDAAFASATGQSLLAFLNARLKAGAVVFSPRPLRALELTPASQVRVVILGQILTTGAAKAKGWRFQLRPACRCRRRCAISSRSCNATWARRRPSFLVPGGSLVKWATHGVLLLNTCLTVEEGKAASHAGKGWEMLTDSVIRQVSAGEHPVLFMLWARMRSPSAS